MPLQNDARPTITTGDQLPCVIGRNGVQNPSMTSDNVSTSGGPSQNSGKVWYGNAPNNTSATRPTTSRTPSVVREGLTAGPRCQRFQRPSNVWSSVYHSK